MYQANRFYSFLLLVFKTKRVLGKEVLYGTFRGSGIFRNPNFESRISNSVLE